jgi:hypothetical protein
MVFSSVLLLLKYHVGGDAGRKYTLPQMRGGSEVKLDLIPVKIVVIKSICSLKSYE